MYIFLKYFSQIKQEQSHDMTLRLKLYNHQLPSLASPACFVSFSNMVQGLDKGKHTPKHINRYKSVFQIS